MFIFFFTHFLGGKYINATDKNQLGNFHEIKWDRDPWCLSQQQSKAQHWRTSCCGRSYKSGYMTSWRSSLRWGESYKPLPIWCSHKICRKTRTELFTLRLEKCKQIYQKKLQNTVHQPQKVQGQQAWVYLSYCMMFAPFLCHRLA